MFGHHFTTGLCISCNMWSSKRTGLLWINSKLCDFSNEMKMFYYNVPDLITSYNFDQWESYLLSWKIHFISNLCVSISLSHDYFQSFISYVGSNVVHNWIHNYLPIIIMNLIQTDIINLLLMIRINLFDPRK